MPKYSFLVPVYNKLECLDRAFTSIFNQTLDDYEIVVINDASSQEGITEYLQELAKFSEKVRVVNHEQNCGIGKTRNDLIHMATGDYLIFVDSDDYIEPELLERVNSSVDKGVDVVRFQCVSEAATENQQKIESQKDPYRFCCKPTEIISGEKALIEWCAGTNKINMLPWSYCVRADLYQNLPFPEMPVLEDYAVMPVVVAKAKKVQAIDYVGYHYMQYDKSLTKQKDIDSEIQERTVKLELLKHATKHTRQNLRKSKVSRSTRNRYDRVLDSRISDKMHKLKKLAEKESMFTK